VTGDPKIAYNYSDGINDYIKYASFNGSSWDISTLDIEEDIGSPNLKLDPVTKRPKIAYWTDTSEGGTLIKYAYHDGSKWNTETIDLVLREMVTPLSLALDPITGDPRVSYAGKSKLYYAEK